jgi:hypothetical protein
VCDEAIALLWPSLLDSLKGHSTRSRRRGDTLDEEDDYDNRDTERELERELEHWATYVQSGDGPRDRQGYYRWIEDQVWLGQQHAEWEESDRWAQSERDRLLRERFGQWEDLQRERGKN